MFIPGSSSHLLVLNLSWMLWEDALGALCSEIQTPQDTFSYSWKECTGHPKSVMAPLLKMPAAQQTVLFCAQSTTPWIPMWVVKLLGFHRLCRQQALQILFLKEVQGTILWNVPCMKIALVNHAKLKWFKLLQHLTQIMLKGNPGAVRGSLVRKEDCL